jgi:hypothetical protein
MWVGAAAQAPAAEVRLLHADPATVRLEALPAATGAQAPTLQVRLEADGRIHTFNLRRNEAMGQLGERLAGRADAYTGEAGPYAGSWAALTRIGNRWSGIWYDGGEYYGIDTAGTLAEASIDAGMRSPDSLMVYRLRDAQWEEMSHEGDTRAVPVSGAQVAKQLAPMALSLPPGTQRRLEVAVVGDALLAERDGEAVEANLLARLNIIDGLFAAQLGVRVAAGSVTIYPSHDDEPFGRTTDADHLLDELSAWRYGNLQQRASGLTHLFTGRNLNGRTVGMAFMDALCARRYSTSLSQATSSVSFSALIAAHEIAHVFGAPHDGDAAHACAAMPTDYLMSPRINGSQQFSSCSIEQMTPQVELASCLTTVRTGWPAEVPAPSTQGGGGTLPLWMPALLGVLVAARRRLQMRANQSAR